MAIEFCTLAAESGCGLKLAFLNSLNGTLRDELACWDETKSLEERINLSICIDNRIRERAREKKTQNNSASKQQTSLPLVMSSGTNSQTHQRPYSSEPMQTGRA
ncbi:hypothetical protein AMECASPLE_001454 [Ameca splendens]|uniref:Uncharacterized protein n=1 Tax=Ameca splendens TaxID=208324 RepID=A0ABV1A5P5_9TELE